jgi:selenocysteine lyase/cysteine desulfurase
MITAAPRHDPGTAAADLDDFRAACPAFDVAAVADLRAREYARLDAESHVYLDYTGGGLYAASQVRQHQELLLAGVFGNPHSTNPTSLAATGLAEGARAAILAFFNADPAEYAVVFTPNASGALKLVGEAYPFGPGDRYLLSADNHNSVHGIRQFARARGARTTYLPLEVPSLRLDPAAVLAALDAAPPGQRRLFAYPAQSNYSGVQHPLDWIPYGRARGWDVLLDAAAFAPTNRLDLGRWRPDFVALSCYKLFGYPTGIGCLIARRAALARLRRPWFAGGTIALASVAADDHILAADEAAFEDGTIDYLGLPAIAIGLRHLATVGVETVRARVRHLTIWLLDRMTALRHPNGAPLVRLYGPATGDGRGGTIAFNLLDPEGHVVDFRAVEARANARRISLRTGCFCNPGASEAARGLTAADLAPAFQQGAPMTLDDLRRHWPGLALGAVRISVGIATTPSDTITFVQFLRDFAAARASAG